MSSRRAYQLHQETKNLCLGLYSKLWRGKKRQVGTAYTDYFKILLSSDFNCYALRNCKN